MLLVLAFGPVSSYELSDAHPHGLHFDFNALDLVSHIRCRATSPRIGCLLNREAVADMRTVRGGKGLDATNQQDEMETEKAGKERD